MAFLLTRSTMIVMLTTLVVVVMQINKVSFSPGEVRIGGLVRKIFSLFNASFALVVHSNFPCLLE
jgi:hypothetical protein